MRKKMKIIIVLIVIIGCVFVYLFNKEIDNFTTKRIDYNGTDLLVSIDGKNSGTLPSSGGYYLSSYKCSSKKTKVSWDRDNYTLSVSNGPSKGRVACDLEFSSKMLLSDVEVGSYVDYTGNNGCEGNYCKGYNANYVSDTDMGYCNNSNYKFTQNGWRVGYIEDGSAYLISGGSPECLDMWWYKTTMTSVSSISLSSSYKYCSSYKISLTTSYYYTLSGCVTVSPISTSYYSHWRSGRRYTCRSSSTSCNTLYQISSYTNGNSYGSGYSHSVTEISSTDYQATLNSLDTLALKYCNKDYAYGGVCDATSSWNFDDVDFEKMTGSSIKGCLNLTSNNACGYNNSLIDNGSDYWFNYAYVISNTNSDSGAYYWDLTRLINKNYPGTKTAGIRPVLKLDSTVYVTGGDGTYESPYAIANS